MRRLSAHTLAAHYVPLLGRFSTSQNPADGPIEGPQKTARNPMTKRKADRARCDIQERKRDAYKKGHFVISSFNQPLCCGIVKLFTHFFFIRGISVSFPRSHGQPCFWTTCYNDGLKICGRLEKPKICPTTQSQAYSISSHRYVDNSGVHHGFSVLGGVMNILREPHHFQHCLFQRWQAQHHWHATFPWQWDFFWLSMLSSGQRNFAM